MSKDFRAPPFTQLVIAFLLIAVYFTAQECAAHMFLGMRSSNCLRVLLHRVRCRGEPVPQPEIPSDGVGISNMRARMSNLYGPHASIQLEKNSLDGIIVTVVIPLVRTPAKRNSLRAL